MKSRWRANMQGAEELKLMLNTPVIKRAVLLGQWEAEHRVLRSSTASPAIRVDCGARGLEHSYTARDSGATLCQGCFQRRVERGQAREAAAHHC